MLGWKPSYWHMSPSDQIFWKQNSSTRCTVDCQCSRQLRWRFVFPHKWSYRWPCFLNGHWVRMVSNQQQRQKCQKGRGRERKSCWVHRTDSMASGVAPKALVWCVTSGEVSSSAWTLATASTRTSANSPSCCCCSCRFFISCWLMWWRIPAPRASPSTFTTVVVRSL